MVSFYLVSYFCLLDTMEEMDVDAPIGKPEKKSYEMPW